MKCISCEIEINPQWKHAVEINVCPFCGKHILEEHLKNLLTSLRETMDSLLSYPEQLDDWMLSNHSYIKTDSPKIGEYMPAEMLKELKVLDHDKSFQDRKNSQKSIIKVQTEAGEEDVLVEKIQSEETTNDFFKRAEVIKKNSDVSPNEKTQHLKKVAQQIRRAGSQGLTDSEGGSMMISPEMLEGADQDAVSEYESMMAGGEIISSLPDTDDDDIPSVVLQMAQKNKGGSNSNAGDLLKLQQLQDKVAASRRNFANGSKGSFSR